jgi:hypothetical protein
MPYEVDRRTGRLKPIRSNPFTPQTTVHVNKPSALGCMGCAISVFGIILLVFILTHVGPIWEWLSRLIGS